MSSVSNSTNNTVTSGGNSVNNNNSNSEDNSTSESEFPRRRSTRRRNYLNRNQLHSALELPEGYGRYFNLNAPVICTHCSPTYGEVQGL